MFNKNLPENELREKAIARLGIASFAIDISIISIIFAFFLPGFMALPWRSYVSTENLALADASAPVLFFGFVLFIYFQVTEFLGVNVSLGRALSGLNLLDPETKQKPDIKARRQRSRRQIFTLGIPTLNPNRVASYNRDNKCCIHSDWLGIPDTNQDSSSSDKVINSRRTSKRDTLKIVSGSNSGNTINIGKLLDERPFVIIGTAPNADIRLLNDAKIAPQQCHIKRHKGNYIIQDGPPNEAKTSHGTRLNTFAVPYDKFMLIKPGNQIRFGQSTVLEFHQR